MTQAACSLWIFIPKADLVEVKQRQVSSTRHDIQSTCRSRHSGQDSSTPAGKQSTPSKIVEPLAPAENPLGSRLTCSTFLTTTIFVELPCSPLSPITYTWFIMVSPCPSKAGCKNARGYGSTDAREREWGRPLLLHISVGKKKKQCP